MDIIINGMPYIKLNPTIYYEYEILAPEINIIDIVSGEKITIDRNKDLARLPKFVIEQLEQNGIIKMVAKEQKDNIGFYQIFSYENDVCYYNPLLNMVFEYSSIEASHQDFISLNELLDHAVYIGRNLKGPNQINLLYEYQDYWLICSNNFDSYTIMNKHDSFFKDYQIDDILPYYYSKNEIMHNIINELKDINKGNNPRK